jgi:hypothetical protein
LIRDTRLTADESDLQYVWPSLRHAPKGASFYRKSGYLGEGGWPFMDKMNLFTIFSDFLDPLYPKSARKHVKVSGKEVKDSRYIRALSNL